MLDDGSVVGRSVRTGLVRSLSEELARSCCDLVAACADGYTKIAKNACAGAGGGCRRRSHRARGLARLGPPHQETVPPGRRAPRRPPPVRSVCTTFAAQSTVDSATWRGLYGARLRTNTSSSTGIAQYSAVSADSTYQSRVGLCTHRAECAAQKACLLKNVRTRIGIFSLATQCKPHVQVSV